MSERSNKHFYSNDVVFSIRRTPVALHLFKSANPKHTLLSDVILRGTIVSSSLSCPLAASVMRLDSLLRLWRYINLFTYLLTE